MAIEASHAAFSFRPGTSPSPSHRVDGAPAQLTSFVGREREIASIRKALASTRLLTLTGAGGSGKTRLALEVVERETTASGQSGVWVELAPLRDPALLPTTILAALAVRDQSDSPAGERLAALLRDRDLLLVLDNCEHLVEASAAITDSLLRSCPRLRVIVTSREALGVTGETAWLVPPLSVPRSDDAAVEDSEAVQLFVQRARAVQPRFELDAENRRAIAQICRRLDGLPLALELAAARLRVLTPEQIAARLDDRFRLLTTGNRTALARHQTLRAAVDWSYQLLQDRERVLLARLAVFADSFTLESVEGVCTGGAVSPENVLDLLSELVEKSLVEMIDAGDVARYRLLETVRQYAAERLAELGEHEERRARHASFFVSLAVEAEPHLTTPHRPEWIARLQVELDDVRAALAWSRDRDPELHTRLVGMLHWFWFATGQWPEARQWLRSALTAPGADRRTRDRAAILFSAGSIAALQARSESARVHLVEAEEIASEVGDARLLAYIRCYLAMALAQVSSLDAERPLALAHEAMRQTNDLYGLRLSFLLESSVHLVRGDVAKAVELAEEGVRVARVFGLDRELAVALQQLAQMTVVQGDPRRAVALLSESLEALRRDPQLFFVARALELMASSLIADACSRDSALDAARLYGAAEAIREVIGAKMWEFDREKHEPRIAQAVAALGQATFDETRAAGRRLTPNEAIEAGLAATSRAGCDHMVDPSTQTGEYAVVMTATTVPAASRGLRVQALGPLEVTVNGAPVPHKSWGYAKARELLVYLLLHPDGRTREQIGAALWPESSAAQVRNNFHVTLHHLRRALGSADWVRFAGERYRLVSPDGGVLALDAAAFEQEMSRARRAWQRGAASAAELRTTLARYRGDFLDGEPAADWHLEHRDHLARLHAEGLEALGKALIAEKSYSEAAATFERLVRQEELNEGAYRALMIARARAGDRTGAMREYRRLEAVLRRELDAGPEDETVALARQIQRGEAV